MPPKPVTRAEHEALCSDVIEAKDEIKEVKALVFELRDNHLKHLQSDVDCIKGKFQVLMPFIYAILSISVLAGLATLFEKLS
jgi:hypothetical protein